MYVYVFVSVLVLHCLTIAHTRPLLVDLLITSKAVVFHPVESQSGLANLILHSR